MGRFSPDIWDINDKIFSMQSSIMLSLAGYFVGGGINQNFDIERTHDRLKKLTAVRMA